MICDSSPHQAQVLQLTAAERQYNARLTFIIQTSG